MPEEKRTATIKAHVTPDEYARLKSDAGRFHFTMSGYVRLVMTKFKIPQSVVDATAILELINARADLARLGNLFKMAINDEGFRDSGIGPAQIQKLIKDIEYTRRFLHDKILSL